MHRSRAIPAGTGTRSSVKGTPERCFAFDQVFLLRTPRVRNYSNKRIFIYKDASRRRELEQQNRRKRGKNAAANECNFQSVEMEKVQCRVFPLFPSFPRAVSLGGLIYLFILAWMLSRLVSPFRFLSLSVSRASFSNFHRHLFVIRIGFLPWTASRAYQIASERRSDIINSPFQRARLAD